MFRITLQKKRTLTVVTLDGRLADADIQDVHRVLSSVKEAAVLSLSDLVSCSEKAVSELRYWIEAGYTIQGATPFMRMLLTQKPTPTLTPPATKES